MDKLLYLFCYVMDEWEVNPSDDEWNEYNPPEAKKVDSLFIPERLACLFKKIEEEKTLAITGGYPRVGANKEVPPTDNTQPSMTPPPSLHSDECETSIGETSEVPDDDKSFEAFNFDDNDNEKPSMKRKTPGSGKRGKKEKVASMSNVMSDLLRHKYLDDLEASKKEEVATENTVA